MNRLEGQDFRDAKNHVYGLAHNVCLNGKEQQYLLDYLHETEALLLREGSSGLLIIKELLSIILTGLAYGNWPWIKNGVNTLEGE